MRYTLKCSILLGVLLVAGCNGDAADTIFHGGPVLTVNAADDVVQALAVRDGMIIAVGSEAEVMAHRGARTEVIDLQGRALLPGFVAAHEHPTLSAVFSGAVDLSGFTHRSDAEVWQALRDAVARTPKGEWIYAGGLDPILTPDLKTPTRQSLDAIAPDHPVVIVSQTLHSYWANSRAFEEVGISRETPDPGAGSYYERDARGELTGFVAEAVAGKPLIQGLKSPLPVYGRYVDELDRLLANGFTSVASLGYNVPPLMARIAASRNFRARIRQFFYLTEDEIRYLPDSPDAPGEGNPYFQVLGVKLWHDGSPYTGSMFTGAAYLDSPLALTLGITPGSHGEAMINREALAEKIHHYGQQGWQLAIHSQGDRSNREVVAALVQAGELKGALPRVRLEHGVFMPSDSVAELTRLGGTASFHIHHIKYYGNALADSIVGRQAAMQVLPVKRAFALGMQPTLHADSPMFPPVPFALMQTAMNRRSDQGLVLNGLEGIDIRQALRAMTINGAIQLRQGDKTGSLEAGKWADLLIVEGNPYETPVSELDKLQIETVIVGGRTEFIAP